MEILDTRFPADLFALYLEYSNIDVFDLFVTIGLSDELLYHRFCNVFPSAQISILN